MFPTHGDGAVPLDGTSLRETARSPQARMNNTGQTYGSKTKTRHGILQGALTMHPRRDEPAKDAIKKEKR